MRGNWQGDANGIGEEIIGEEMDNEKQLVIQQYGGVFASLAKLACLLRLAAAGRRNGGGCVYATVTSAQASKSSDPLVIRTQALALSPDTRNPMRPFPSWRRGPCILHGCRAKLIREAGAGPPSGEQADFPQCF